MYLQLGWEEDIDTQSLKEKKSSKIEHSNLIQVQKIEFFNDTSVYK